MAASYLGDSSYNTSISSTTALAGEQVPPSVTVIPSSSSITTAQTLAVMITVSSGNTNPTPTGSVKLSSATYTSVATALSNGSAIVSIPAGSLATGTDLLTVNYTPDAASSSIYNSALGTNSVTVTAAPAKSTPTVTVTPSSSNITTAQALTVTVTINGGTGKATPTGSATLTGGGYTSGAATLTSGSAIIAVPASSLAIGSDTLTASYTGDGNYQPATGSASVLITALNMPTPSFSPSGGTYSSAQTVNISSTAGRVTIYYTTNGATPTTGSAIYSSPITVSASETVKAIATANGYNPSAVGSASYTIGSGSTGGAQGAYFGSTSNGEPFEGIILPNNKFYALYGTTSGNVFNIMGMITGQGSSTNGTYSAPITDYYYNGATYTGSVSASYVAGTRINGNIFDSGVGTLSFTGSALPTSQYNFNVPASLSTIVGAWNGALLGGGGASVNLSSNGTFTGSSQGCSYSGSISPDASGMNFFNFSLSYGGSPCLLPYQTQTGIAIDYLLSDGVTRQLVAGVSSGSSGNVFAANRNGGSASATYSLSTTSPIVVHGSSGTTTVTVSSTSGYTGTIVSHAH